VVNKSEVLTDLPALGRGISVTATGGALYRQHCMRNKLCNHILNCLLDMESAGFCIAFTGASAIKAVSNCTHSFQNTPQSNWLTKLSSEYIKKIFNL
jgi:hypothetical protein